MRTLVLICLFPAVAMAQAGGAPAPVENTAPTTAPPPGPTPPPTVQVAAAPTGAMAGMQEDPSNDHTFFQSTALTNPKGAIEVNDWELLLLGVTYAITDNIQASLTGLIPITDGFPIFLIGSAKIRIPLANDRLHLAVAGSILYTHDAASSSDISINFDYAGALAEGFVTYCLDARCRSTLNGGLGFGFSISESNPVIPIIYSFAAVGAISQHFKILGELVSGGVAGLNSNFDTEFLKGVELTYGVRFCAHAVAVDLGFTRPVADGTDAGIIIGYPLVTVSGRFGI